MCKKLIPFIVISILAGTLMLSCKEKMLMPDPNIVAAVSGGVLERREPVRVEFTQSQDTEKPLAGNVFSLSPSVKGEVSWLNDFTLVFTPSQAYRPAQRYVATVKLEGIDPFSFDFMTVAQVFSVQIDPIQLLEDSEVQVSGTVTVDDEADISKIEQTVNSRELGKPWWSREGTVHRFYFEPVKRAEASRTVEVTWNGSAVGVSERGFTTVMIPGTDTFQMIDLRVNNGIIEVTFSSQLKANQDIRGFVSLAGNTNVRYSLEGNRARIFGDNSGGLPIGAELIIQDLEDV
ncbi:MAG: alpha-2-macroglobulin, partial [Treponema sp.]|nr:alpha-2-macroglobulin [Treponema sp.]